MDNPPNEASAANRLVVTSGNEGAAGKSHFSSQLYRRTNSQVRVRWRRERYRDAISGANDTHTCWGASNLTYTR